MRAMQGPKSPGRRATALAAALVAIFAGIVVAAGPAAAESSGCRLVNQVFGRGVTALAPTIGSATFDAGDRLTLTVSGAQGGTPVNVEIRRLGTAVAVAPYPGTATWIVPASGPVTQVAFVTDPSVIATFRVSCVPGPPPAPPADTSPPIVEPVVAGTLGADGWYVSDVVVGWQVHDGDSPVTGQFGCSPVAIAFDTPGIPLTCTATSAGGTTATTVSVRRDATPPVLAPDVAPKPVLLRGAAHVDAGASDAMSGVASASCDEPSTATAGPAAVWCTAVDAAGNTAHASASFVVEYAFHWLSWDGDAKAGSAIPLRWSLADAHGAPVDAAAATLHTGACGATAPDRDERAAGSSGIVQPGSGTDHLVWKTSKRDTGECRSVFLDAGDGVARVGDVRLR